MKRLNIFLLLLFCNVLANAQQDPLFSQYTYNKLLLNPAYAGSKEGLELIVVNRAQWVGLDGAPNTLTLSAHSPIREKKVGLGFYISRDAIGPTVNNSLMGSYSYRLLMPDGFFAFGLQAGVKYYDFNWAEMNLKDQDYMFDPSNVRKVTPDVNLGFYFQSKHLFAGLSSKHLLENDYGFIQDDNGNSFSRLVRHFYFMAGTVFPLVDEIMFRPSCLVKYARNVPAQLDVNASVLFHEKFLAGVSFRTEKAIAVMAAFGITKKIKLGYAFDWYFNELQLHNYGSHEIRLEFNLKKKDDLVQTNKYF